MAKGHCNSNLNVVDKASVKSECCGEKSEAKKEPCCITSESLKFTLEDLQKEKETLAYYLWESAGMPEGEADRFYFEAENMIKNNTH